MTSEPAGLDWPSIRSLILTELEPRRLLERIDRDRRANSGYPWTGLGFKRWDPGEMDEPEFDRRVKDLIARIKADPETSETLNRLESLGFHYLLGTYDEPGVRLFHINVQHNERAEARVRGDGWLKRWWRS